VFQIAPNKAVFLYAHFQCGSTGVIDRRRAVLLCQGKNPEDAAGAELTLLAMSIFYLWIYLRREPQKG